MTNIENFLSTRQQNEIKQLEALIAQARQEGIASMEPKVVSLENALGIAEYDIFSLKNTNEALAKSFTALEVKHRELQAKYDAATGTTTPPEPPTPPAAKPLTGFWAGTDAPGVSEGARGNYDRVSGYLGKPKAYRMFYSGSPGTNFVGSSADYGPPVVVSFKFKPQEVVTGKHDATLKSWFNSIPTDREVWWSYFHEPENDMEGKPNAVPPVPPSFTGAEYRAAWTHILNLAPKRANLHSMLILMEYSLRKTSRKIDDYVAPGVDILAWDAYLTAGSKTIAQVLERTKQVSDSYGMGFAITEVAVAPAYSLPNKTKEETVYALVEALLANTTAKVILWFESHKIEPDGKPADWRMRPYASAVELWKSKH